jgi:hypothetical protein
MAEQEPKKELTEKDAKALERQERVAKALRDNLRRRKQGNKSTENKGDAPTGD